MSVAGVVFSRFDLCRLSIDYSLKTMYIAYSVAFRDSFDTFAFGGSFEINELYSGVVRELRYIAYMAELYFGTAAAITHSRLRRGNVYVQRR